MLRRYNLKDILLVGAAVIALSAPVEARVRGGAAAVSPDNTCLNGEDNAELDGCRDAHADATFRMSDMDDYFRDDDGDIAVLAVRPGHAPGMSFNVPMRDFPIGPRYTTFKDPAEYSFTTTGSNVNGTTFTAGTVTSGTVRNGLKLFSLPSTAGLLTNYPVLSDCTGGGGNGTTCTLSISQSNKSGPYNGSHAPGCYWTNGGASKSSWACDGRYPNQAQIWDFDNFDFGATGGHTSSTLFINQRDNGVPTLKVTNSRIVVDAQTNGQNIILTNPGIDVNLVFEDNECDGGNSSVATGETSAANFNFSLQTSCINWAATGSPGGRSNAISVSFKRNWIHDFAGNPVQINQGYADVITQANVFYRLGMNNGNTDVCPTCTGLHGASINWNTTDVGSQSWIRRYNDVVIYPYGTRPGVTTAPFAQLGGLGSAVQTDYDQQLTTAIMNVAEPGRAIASQWTIFLRVGAISNVNIKNNYVSTGGVGPNGCFLNGGDVNIGNITASMTPSVGNDWSTWNVTSGFNTTKEKPYPGQIVYPGAGSTARAGYMSFTNLGDGTSRMDITETVVGPTNDFQKWPVQALGLANPITNPTLIISQIDSDSYVVDDGTGTGRDLSNRFFSIGFGIEPFGANGTTATGGSTPSNYQGSYSLTGEGTVSSTTSWDAYAIVPTNYDTVEADIAENYDVISGNSLTIGGIDWSRGNCPGTNPG